MRRSRLLKFLGLGVVVVVTGIVLVGTLLPDTEVHLLGITGGIALAEPAFALAEDRHFLQEEAGMAAYMQTGQTIDVGKAKGVFRTIEKQTDTYIVGSVALPDYTAAEDVHVFVHQEGWLVSYYTREEPASKIVDWARYTPGSVPTKLELGLSIVAGWVGVPVKNVNYYAFHYPSAEKLTVIADSTTDGFYLTIPSEFTIHERAVSSSNHAGTVQRYGRLSPGELSLDVRHFVNRDSYRVRIDGKEALHHGSGCRHYAIVLVYREP